MSSKSAESPRPRRPRWSITARLTLLVALSTFAMLLAGGLFLYWVLERNLDREDTQFLADKLFVLQAVLRDHPDELQALDEEVRLEGTARQFNRYYTRVLDENGGVVAATAGMDVLVPADQFPKPEPAGAGLGSPAEFETADGKTFALASAWASPGSGQRRLLQVMLDVSHEEAVLASYRRNLVLVLLAGLAVSVLAGRSIARRGLAPLADITQTARNITAARLDARIGPEEWPRELTLLAGAFDEMLGRLEDSFRRVSQFSGDIAHELRTPITNFLTESQVILSRSRSPAEYQEVLESGVEEFSRLARMIETLLFLARAENAQSRIERIALDGSKEVTALIEFHLADAEENGVTLQCAGQARVYADPVLLQRALSNLLTNAVRYTPRGGCVTVTLAQTGSDSEICVADTGAGIAPEHLPHVFDRFYRPDASRTHRTGGFGLGLSLVKSIVTLHGGTVRLQSGMGAGTQVTLSFPAAAGTAQT